MRYFAQYIVGRNGPIDVFLQPQTPQLIADEVVRKLTSHNYLDGERRLRRRGVGAARRDDAYGRRPGVLPGASHLHPVRRLLGSHER